MADEFLDELDQELSASGSDAEDGCVCSGCRLALCFFNLLSSCRADDLVSAERVRRKTPLSRERARLPGLNPQLDMLAPALPMLCRFQPPNFDCSLLLSINLLNVADAPIRGKERSSRPNLASKVQLRT